MTASKPAYPPGSRKIDKALTDMQHHLDWLRDHAQSHEDHVRMVGVMECMDILAKYHAKVIQKTDSAAGAEQ